jgi:dolichol-phosphate mannosyltransferase
MSQLDIVVPAKNEAENIGDLVRRVDNTLRPSGINYRLIIVNDYSSDATLDTVIKLSTNYPIKAISNVGKPGKAFAVLAGCKQANAPIVAMIDADLQYPPEKLPEMYGLAKVYGMAVANRKKRGTSFIRKIGSFINTQLFEKVLHGFDVDVQSGMKVFKREIVEFIADDEVTPWTIDMPLLFATRQLGYQIKSVDITFSDRKNGISKINFLKAAFEIAKHSLKLKFFPQKTHQFKPLDGSTIGSGVIVKGIRFITHTKLPVKYSAIRTLVGRS